MYLIKIVEGPVVGGIFDRQSIGKPTRLQIGKLDSDTDRFSVFFWMDHREKFMRKFPPNPETYLLGKTVRVRGFIDDPKGYPQIVLSDPADIWIVE